MPGKVSTKEPTYIDSKPQVINNQFYGSNSDDNSLYDDTNFEVSNEAVAVSSPAYGHEISSLNYPTEDSVKITQHGTSHSESFSSELPTRIYSSTMSSMHSEEAYDTPNSVQLSKDPYDHSDITYSPSESEISMENSNSLISQYPFSTPETFYTETRTEATEKNKFSKPIFKLKPTHHPTSTEKYVLVHTISNDKQSEGNQDKPTKKPSTNESIQSIILMLNGSNPGPEYGIDSMNVNNNNYHSVTPSFGSTSMIDREKYGSSSYYITTKNPSNHPTTLSVPSTSYVYSPNPTRRQTTKTTTLKNYNQVKITPTRSPQSPTTLNVPSTSYVYSANPITKRPTTAPSSSTASSTTVSKTRTTNIIKKTTPKPMIIVKRPSSDVENGYVVISGGGITKHPSPTVHITPKPITNILTSSTMGQAQQTKRPSNEKSSTTPSVTERPPFYPSTSPATFISSSIYVPAIQDFHNEGYFLVTHRPSAGVSSTAIYTINSGTLNNHPSDIKVSSSNVQNDLVDFNDEVPIINNDDFSNFPPVRNPNLNMTGTNGLIDESQISTPAFVEDEQLNGKIDLLVNKLVASMQGNLDNLIDIVYERKNISAPVHDISSFNKNGSLLQDEKPTKSTQTPGKVTTVKVPSRITTGRPSPATTKKTPSKATLSTKKPSTGTKKPSQKPITNSQTSKKPPARVTTTLSTKKPTRRVSTTSTTSTTERAPVEDEIIEEEGEDASETNEENEEDNNVEEPEENEAIFPPLESGKIRNKHFPN